MYEDLKQECFESNLKLPELQLVIYTFGNVSCADRSKGSSPSTPRTLIMSPCADRIW